MDIQIKRHLEALSQKDPDQRRQTLAQILATEELSYTTQEAAPSFKQPGGIVNYLLSPWHDQPGLLFCAHYDAVPGSCGANDNAAAVCLLIDLARELKSRQFPAYFAFFDGEERGLSGSKLYVSNLDRKLLTGVVNLDMCGFGDSIAICGKGHEKKRALRPFCDKALLQKHRGQVLKYLPKSDEASFAGSRVPALSICIVPRWDIQYLKALATYGDGLIGRPPEYDMMLEQMEVTTTMHGGYRDTPDYVEESAMEQVYHYLLEAVTR